MLRTERGIGSLFFFYLSDETSIHVQSLRYRPKRVDLLPPDLCNVSHYSSAIQAAENLPKVPQK
jgi:hypothetical protein